MFTGLIEQVGEVRGVRKSAGGTVFDFQTTYDALTLGESVAVNGVCLTVTTFAAGRFTADASNETLGVSTLGQLSKGDHVHLERALRVGDRLGGHLVSGHVDGVGEIAKLEPLGDAVKMVIRPPAKLLPFLAPKASVTIDGVSLTINGASGALFDVALVPFTQSETNFEGRTGHEVNLEVDVLAKYVARLLGRPGVDGEPSGGGGLSAETLRKHGFI